MKKTLLLFSLLFSLLSFAQYEVTVNAFVLDKVTKQPVPYANIGFIDKAVGTVSDTNGAFSLVYDDDKIVGVDMLQISCLGYETLKVSKKQFERYLVNNAKIFLTPKIEALDVVTIGNDKKVQVRLGSFDSKTKLMGYWKDKKALGGELATKIKVRKKNTQLLDLKFNIIENASDSLKVRVNIYDYKKRLPNTKLNNTNIYYTITKSEGVETINLEPFNIFANDEVIVSIELVEVYGDAIGFAVSARKDPSGDSFIRYISQDKWQRMINVAVNFSVLTSETIDAKSLDDKRNIPETITIYWDASASMKDKNLAKELKLLKQYLNAFKRVNVNLVTFSFGTSNQQKFVVNKGGSKNLINYIESLNYVGATSYKSVLKNNDVNADLALVFTDGKSIFSQMEPQSDIPVFTINSKADANHFTLQRIAAFSDGHYINLHTEKVNDALEYMLKEIDDYTDYENSNLANIVEGEVVYGDNKLQGVSVKVKNTFREVKTDLNGQFSIQADEDDVLEFNMIGMNSKSHTVSNAKNIKIELMANANVLGEVLVKAEKEKQGNVESVFGKERKEAIGYSVNTLTEKDVRPGMIFMSDLIRGRFPGVQVFGRGIDATYRVRGISSISNETPPLWEVDGVIFQDTPNFLDPSNIASISVIKSLAGTAKYGPQGRGGVFVVRTKKAKGRKPPNLDTLKVKGNDYKETLPLLSSKNFKPNYINQLEKSNSYEDAITIYNELLNNPNFNSIPFYLDSAEYFLRWNKDKALDIILTISEIADGNAKALKALAYKLEQWDEFELARSVYEEILAIRPKDAQSYRDLALIYTQTKKYEEAANIYKQILNGSIQDVDFTGLGKVIETEFINLLKNHRIHFNYKDLPNDLLSSKLEYDIRLVFEWNDPQSEFELQFVNPDKKYYNWAHTIFDNRDRVLDGVKDGYHIEEYVINKDKKGEWIINIQSLGEENTDNPTYLKYTIYKNYGRGNESKETHVIKLYDQKQKVTLDKLYYK